jgi:hypothetical protein
MNVTKHVQVPVISCALALAGLILSGCASSRTHVVAYPPSDEFFVTMGDDPGSESIRPYSPKGTLIHVSEEGYIPLPLLGLATIGNANPQYVMEEKVLPRVRYMGGDAMSSTKVDHVPPPNGFARFLGFPLIFMQPSRTVVTGQVDKR